MLEDSFNIGMRENLVPTKQLLDKIGIYFI